MLAPLERIGVHGTCGPLDIIAEAQDAALADAARMYLSLFSSQWSAPERSVRISLVRGEPRAHPAGNFLSCVRMRVDRSGSGYTARTKYELTAQGTCGPRCDDWIVCVPPGLQFDEPQTGDMEDILSLICTVAWREAGWVAVHAAAVAKDGVCAVLCASSGGGKSTLTTALVRSGWRSLGDDKLLVRCEDGIGQVRALLQTFNLDPAAARRLGVGDVETLPRYSAFTNKRRVDLDAIGANAALASAMPTHAVNLIRNSSVRGIRASAMKRPDVLPLLLRQIVLPSDPAAGRWILAQMGACARGLRGITLEVGDDAYSQDGWLAQIEEAILCPA